MYSCCAGLDLICQFLDGVGTRHGIHGVRHACFMRDDLLRPQGQQRGRFRRQRERLVQRVRVQRLAPAQHRR